MVTRWCRVLSEYTPDEIKRGVLACEEMLSPPSLGRFRQMCRPPQLKQNANAYQFGRGDFIALTKLPTQTHIAKTEMRLIKLIMGGDIEDYDETTELKIEAYYKARPVDPKDHVKVKEFLSMYS